MEIGSARVSAGPSNAALTSSIVATLQQLGTPATALQVAKLLPKGTTASLPEVRTALSALAQTRAIHAWGKRFTLHDPEQIILGALRSGALTQAELARRLNEIAPGLAATAELRRVLKALCRRNIVKEHPKVGKAAQRYGLEPPSLSPFIKPAARALRAAEKRLQRSGVGLPELVRALAAELGQVHGARAPWTHTAADSRAADLSSRHEVMADSQQRLRTLPGVPAAIARAQQEGARLPAAAVEARATNGDGDQRRRQTLPGVPTALRASDHARRETLPDAPQALRIDHLDETTVLGALQQIAGPLAPRAVPLDELKAASGLEGERFTRAVLALTERGNLSVQGTKGTLSGPLAVELIQDETWRAFAHVLLPQVGSAHG